MSHRNNNLDLWNFQLEQQGLKKYDDQLYNPMRNNEVRRSDHPFYSEIAD